MVKRRATLSIVLIALVAMTVLKAFPKHIVNADQPAAVRLLPSTIQINESMIGSTITFNLTIENVVNLWQWAVKLTWDPAVLNITGAQEGPFLKTGGATLFIYPSTSPKLVNGTLPEVSDTLMVSTGVNGSGLLGTVAFKIVSANSTQVALTVTSLVSPADLNDPTYYTPPISHVEYGASVGVMPIPEFGLDAYVFVFLLCGALISAITMLGPRRQRTLPKKLVAK